MSDARYLLTVVIPVFNRDRIVSRTLDSISEQTSRDFCVILVDNNSTDRTHSILTDWASRQSFDVKVMSELRPGAASARQTGLEAVDTPWVMFFDSDDTMTPDHISNAAKAIRSNPDADIVSWNIRQHRPDGSCRILSGTDSCDQYKSLFGGTTASQRYCAKTSLVRDAGGWDRSLGVWDDIELGARLLARNPSVLFLKNPPTVDTYIQHDSITQGETADNLGMINRALTAIAYTLGPKHREWVNLKLMIVAANTPGQNGRELRLAILSKTKKHRLLLQIAFLYTRIGGRGIARILSPLMKL